MPQPNVRAKRLGNRRHRKGDLHGLCRVPNHDPERHLLRLLTLNDNSICRAEIHHRNTLEVDELAVECRARVYLHADVVVVPCEGGPSFAERGHVLSWRVFFVAGFQRDPRGPRAGRFWLTIGQMKAETAAAVLLGLNVSAPFWVKGAVPARQGCCGRENWGVCPGVLHKPSYVESSPWCAAYMPRPPCRLHSFGIGDSWDFERRMLSHGCTVDAYDPTIGLRRRHARYASKHGLTFHFGGLGDASVAPPNNSYGIINTRTLRPLVDWLSSTPEEDVSLKIDCEGCEWAALTHPKAIKALASVRLLFLELHVAQSMSPPTPGQLDALLSALHAAGLRLWWLRHNPGFRRDRQVAPALALLKPRSCCYELALVREPTHKR